MKNTLRVVARQRIGWLMATLIIFSAGPAPAEEATAGAGDTAETRPPPGMISIKALILSVPEDVAEDWGLDGGPPSKGSSNPDARGLPVRLQENEAAEFLQRLRGQPGVQTISSGQVMTRSGVPCQLKRVVEVIYATGTDENGAPRKFETRQVGTILNVTPTLSPPGPHQHIDMAMANELARLVGWGDALALGDEPSVGQPEGLVQPVFTSNNFTTMVICKPGDTYVFSTGVPAYGESLTLWFITATVQ